MLINPRRKLTVVQFATRLTRIGHLNEHMRIHSNARPYTIALQFAIRVLHTLDIWMYNADTFEWKIYSGIVCSKSFAQCRNLNEHMQIIHSNKYLIIVIFAIRMLYTMRIWRYTCKYIRMKGLTIVKFATRGLNKGVN